MAAFDMLLRVTGFGVNVAQDEQGRSLEAQLAAQIATVIPVGPNEVAPLPIGQIRMPFDRNAVKALIDQLTDAYNQMDNPPTNKLVIPGSDTDVDRVAQEFQNFQG